MRKKIFICLLVIIAFLSGNLSFKTSKNTVYALEEKFSADKINNIVVCVNFADSEDFVTSTYISELEATYNSSDISVKKYFNEVSNGKLEVETFFPNSLKDGKRGITVENSLNYYLPKFEYNKYLKKYVEENPQGYDNRYYLGGVAVAPETVGALKHVDSFYREQMLLREVVSLIDVNSLPTDLDNDNDGLVDSVSFILNTEVESGDYGELIWPHMTSLFEYDDGIQEQYFVPTGYEDDLALLDKAYLKDFRVYKYNVLSYGYMQKSNLDGDYEGLGDVGVICHEFMHTLGIYDYYAYDNDDRVSVGEFDIMGTTTAIPQYPLSYVREKMGWLSAGKEILAVESDGRYTLYPVTANSKVKAYKIVLNDYLQTGEYYMIECRSSEDTNGKFDSLLSGSGLIIYRINEKNAFIGPDGKESTVDYGNMYGQEEVYVLRCGDGKEINTSSFSLALLNGNTVTDGLSAYDKSTFGYKDKSKDQTTVNSGLSFLKPKITVISGSDGKNSGIYLEDIEENQDGSFSFTIDIPDDSSDSVEFITAPDLKNHYDGSIKAFWDTENRNGDLYFAVIKDEGNLVSLAEKGKALTAEEVVSGESLKWEVLQSAKIPVSFKEFKIDKESCDYAVFAVYVCGDYVSDVNYAGLVTVGDSSQKEDFWGYLKSGCKSNALADFACAILVMAVAVLIIVIKKSKKIT